MSIQPPPINQAIADQSGRVDSIWNRWFLVLRSAVESAATSVSVRWGQITGTLADQADLKAALDGKASTAQLSGLATTDYVHAAVSGGLTGYVPQTRQVNTTAPLTGGGDLSADRTLDVSNFTGDSGSGGAKGTVPAPAAGDAAANKFLKADGNWTTVSPMVYPGAGIPVSTGSAWGASLSETDGDIIAGVTGAWTKTTALPNGITATTQTAADNSTKVATTAYVDSAVSSGGFGNVTGAASSTDGDIVLFSGATGKALKESNASISTDGTMAGNSDALVSTQKAIVTYMSTHGVLEFIAEQVLSGTAANVTFSSIPSTYRHLKLFITARTDAATPETGINMQANGDTAGNYDAAHVFGNSSGTGNNGGGLATATAPIGHMPGASATANCACAIETIIPNYSKTTFFKTAFSQDSYMGTTFIVLAKAWQWRSTAAINALKLTPGSGNFVSGCIFQLYGIR